MSQINSNMPLPEQIRAQAGSDTVVIDTGSRRVELTRQQADAVLAGAELVIDPLTGKVEVRA